MPRSVAPGSAPKKGGRRFSRVASGEPGTASPTHFGRTALKRVLNQAPIDSERSILKPQVAAKRRFRGSGDPESLPGRVEGESLPHYRGQALAANIHPDATSHNQPRRPSMNATGTASADLQDPQLLAAMPLSFRELVRVIPMRMLWKLAEALGGARVYVPKQPNASSRLSSVLDPASFAALTALHGAECIEIPRAAAMRRVFRDREMMKLRAAGHSAAKVARDFGVHPRTVFHVARRWATTSGSPT